MKKVILCISLFLFAGFVFSQTPVFDQSISIDQTFTTDTEIFPFNGEILYGAGVNGNITFNSDSSLIRIILKDSLSFEYIVYETYPMLDTVWNFTFNEECDETCFFDGYVATSMIIQVRDASVYLDLFVWSNSPSDNPVTMQKQAKISKDIEKINELNSYILEHRMIWKPGETILSNMFYEEKKSILGEKYQLYGFEFYSGGVFGIFEPNADPKNASYNYIDNFDWRKTHGANNPTSYYYDGDENGSGWMTPPKCQSGCWDFDNEEFLCISSSDCDALPNAEWRSTGGCVGFGAIGQLEALTHIYFNINNFNIDLSEQHLFAANGHLGGVWPSEIYTHHEFIKDNYIVDEECFPFEGINVPLIEICDNPEREEVSYENFQVVNSNEDEVKEALINDGPLAISTFFTPWYPTGMSHSVLLTGFDIIEVGDELEQMEEITLDHPFLGNPFWIYKDSGGLIKGDNGYIYVFFTQMPTYIAKLITPITSVQFSDDDVQCIDADNDGYFNWGIGSKPDHCQNCPDEVDGNDFDGSRGPRDSKGTCSIINNYNTSFEINFDGWMQSPDDDLDWIKNSGPTPTDITGPDNAQDGTFYIYIEASVPQIGYPEKTGIIESPILEMDNYCMFNLNFWFHKLGPNGWGHDDSKFELQVSYDEGNTWVENIWFADEDFSSPLWTQVSIDLPPNMNKLRFIVTTGNTQYNDMALDNITISPISATNPITIVGEVEWSGEHVICSNIEIEPNSSLTLMPGCELKMFTNAKIIVKRSGELVIDDAHVTDNNNQLWQGIEVWGNANQPQSYAYQGAVKVINGGVIENAIIGVQTIKMSDIPPPGESTPNYNYTGGMVLCDEAIFKNNQTAVKFWQYEYAASNSLFRDCQFVTNDDMLAGTDPGYFIKMSDISGINIQGCVFDDTHPVSSPDELTSGIEAFDSFFKVFSSTSQTSLFTGLYDGIRAYARSPETVTIINGQFTNNLRSVYLSGVMEATVTGNLFNSWEDNVPAGEESYCLYMDYCTDYIVEENIFSYGGAHPKGIGLVINNSGANNNEIYNNEFTNLEFATLAQNYNRSNDPDIGLVIKCNDYDDNSNDIAVTANEEVEYPGIAKHQGAEGETEMQAGNRFSLNNNGNDISDYSTFKQGPITYFHHDPISEPRVKPIYYTDKYIYLDNQNTPYSENGSCPSHLSEDGGGSGIARDGLQSNMASSGFKADSTQALLTALVDGGNTVVLQQEVFQTMPQEAYDLYMSLMGKSPYLSDSVLIATIEKEYILPNVLIKDILTANPQAAKSTEVMDKVDEKAIPMTEEQLAEILLGKYIVAAKEKLESQLAWYKHQRSISLKFLKQSYRNDTVDPYALDSLVLLLETENGLQEKFELVFAYSAQNNWTGAMALLNDLPNQYSFKQHEQEMYDDYSIFINVLYELDQAGTGLEGLTDAQNTTLLQLADNTQNFAGAYARNILIGKDNYPYTEPIILPGDGLKSGSITFDLPVPKDYRPGYINIYPNPAMSYIIVQLNITNLNGINIGIYDNSGKLIKSVTVPERTQDYVIGLKGMKPGIYIIKADMDGKDIGGKKFSIIK